MYSRVCVWAETDNFGLIIVVETVCIFKTSVFLADARSWLHAAVFNTAFYIKPYRIIASSFMNTLWVCLLTVKDSFRVFASTFIRNCAAQFPSVTWTGEAKELTFCFAVIKLKLYAQFLSSYMYEERVMHLIFKSSLQEQHSPLSEGYFIVCWSNECSGYFKGGKFSSADESYVNFVKDEIDLVRAKSRTNWGSQDFSWPFFFARNLWSRKCSYQYKFGCIWEDLFFICRAGVGRCQRFLNFFLTTTYSTLVFGIEFQECFLLLKSSFI